jgi:UDP-glucose 4-epimerase
MNARRSWKSILIYDLSIRLWKLGRLANWLAKLPGIGSAIARRLFGPDENQAILIPVNQAVRSGQSVVLPYTLLTPLIERASHRAVLNHCMCRQAEGCEAYPQDLGCLFLGAGAAQINPALAHPVDSDAALSHMREAMSLGLMPTVLHSSLDAFMLQIPFRRMLAICFCCDCCCTIRQGMRLGPPAALETITRLPGLTLQVGDACLGCGACVGACPVNAIMVKADDKAVVSDLCKGCGRCLDVCPTGAISLQISEDVPKRLRDLVNARTKITA